MKRWLVLPLGLAIALLAAWALLTAPSGDRGPAVSTAPAAKEPPHGDYDEQSRDELLRILREADGDSTP